MQRTFSSQMTTELLISCILIRYKRTRWFYTLMGFVYFEQLYIYCPNSFLNYFSEPFEIIRQSGWISYTCTGTVARGFKTIVFIFETWRHTTFVYCNLTRQPPTAEIYAGPRINSVGQYTYITNTGSTAIREHSPALTFRILLWTFAPMSL